MWHMRIRYPLFSMKSMLAPHNVMDSNEALRQATICLSQMKEEVEEMEMSGEHEDRGGPCWVSS